MAARIIDRQREELYEVFDDALKEIGKWWKLNKPYITILYGEEIAEYFHQDLLFEYEGGVDGKGFTFSVWEQLDVLHFVSDHGLNAVELFMLGGPNE